MIQLSHHVEYYVVDPSDPTEILHKGLWGECREMVEENPKLKIYFNTPDKHLFPSQLRH